MATVLVFPCLDQLSPESLSHWRTVLSSEDGARADTFGSAQRRRQFIAGRYLLTSLIQMRLRINPLVSMAESGAPRVEGVALNCSIAHSGSGVVVAINSHGPLGVDIEWLRPRRFDILAAAYFHPSEAAAIQAQPSEQKGEMFYRLWTRKEARAKAGGVGLTLAGLASAAVDGDDLALQTVRWGDFVISVADRAAESEWLLGRCSPEGVLSISPLPISDI